MQQFADLVAVHTTDPMKCASTENSASYEMTVSTQGPINFSRRDAGSFGGVDQCLVNNDTKEYSSHDLLLGMVPNLLPTEFELQAPEHSLHSPSADSGTMNGDRLHAWVREKVELPFSATLSGKDYDVSQRLRAKTSSVSVQLGNRRKV